MSWLDISFNIFSSIEWYFLCVLLVLSVFFFSCIFFLCWYKHWWFIFLAFFFCTGTNIDGSSTVDYFVRKLPSMNHRWQIVHRYSIFFLEEWLVRCTKENIIKDPKGGSTNKQSETSTQKHPKKQQQISKINSKQSCKIETEQTPKLTRAAK